ncbi:MAG: tetratricopeptide repeat protein [Phycisphaerales bacterium]
MSSAGSKRVGELIDLQQWEAAEKALLASLRLKPGDVENTAAMAYVLLKRKDFVRAEHFAERTLAMLPGDPRALANLGAARLGVGKIDAAIADLQRAVEGLPEDPLARTWLAIALLRSGRASEALAVARRGLEFAPGHALLHAQLGSSLHMHGRADEAYDALRRAAELDPASDEIAMSLASTSNYAPNATPEAATAHHVRLGDLIAARHGMPATIAADVGEVRAGARPLRVGIISPDLRAHATAYFIEPFVTHADRSRVMIACYHTGRLADDVSRRFEKASSIWRHLHGRSFRDAAAMIRADRLDVLLELAGLTDGNALPALHVRAAPVQATYIGYPSTTGVRSVDVRLVDSITDPAGFEPRCVERLHRLDAPFLCYSPPAGVPEVAPVPSLAGAPITFGSFSAFMKIHTGLLAVWARVLHRVPGSRLMLKHVALSDDGVAADVRERMASLGITEDRLVLERPSDSSLDVLARYAAVDVSLDTFPYNGTTTVCESLLMGVPMVTKVGTTSAGRVSESLLRSVGVGELVARDDGEFVELAARLATDAAELRRYRSALRPMLLASPLCDGRGFAARLTDTLMVIAGVTR